MPDNQDRRNITSSQLLDLFEYYNDILKYELHLLGCDPTELRHLIGRIGEIYSAIESGGQLAKTTNQHGFDVKLGNNKISVKTTAQKTGFISLNSRTLHEFDLFHVIQYKNSDFQTIYYGDKQPVIDAARQYQNKLEISIFKLKSLFSSIY